MKGLFIKIGIFVVGLVLLNLFLYQFVFHDLLYSRYILDNKKISKHKYLLFGDSHTQALAQPFLKGMNMYNLSYGSDSYIDIFLKLDFILKKSKPSAVLVTADDYTLSLYRESLNNKKRSILYSDYKTYTRFYDMNLIKYYYDKYVYRYIPMLNLDNSKLFNKWIFAKFLKQSKPKAKEENWRDKKNKERACKGRMKHQFPDTLVSQRMMDGLLAIISLCRENDVQVIGIKLPIARTYLEILDGKSYHADSVFIRNGLPVLDYKTLFIDHDEYFRNQDHLNQAGAKKLVEILKNDLGDLPVDGPIHLGSVRSQDMICQCPQ